MSASNAVFISYRRSDSNDVTGRIYDFLSQNFGFDVVFKDVDSIPLGVDCRLTSQHYRYTLRPCHWAIPMTLQHLQSQLLALSTEEQAQVIQLLTANLNGTWINIEKFPDSPQNDAFIRQTGIAVWFIVHRRNQGTTDADLLAEYPDLSAVDLANAWLYAQLHNDEIQAAIQRYTTGQLTDPDDDPTEEILSDLKQAWQEAQSGHTIPLSQMWNGIDA